MFACRNYRLWFVYLFWEKTNEYCSLMGGYRTKCNHMLYYPKNKDMMGRYLLNTNSHHSRHTHLLYTKPVLDRVGEVNVCMGPHHVCFDGEEYLLAYAKNVSPISHTEFLIFYKLDKHTTHTKLDNTTLLR